jgi:hypothetical protein
MKNYRPVSLLPFIAKCLEKVVCARIERHLHINLLHDPMQSAYRKGHSTETALLKVQSDILTALDQKKCVALLMLDLSAAFDTLEHSILLQRLDHTHGIRDSALLWMKSYLHGRTQAVIIDGSVSDDASLDHGVPQGSVVGPMGYSLYTVPVGSIIRKHNLNYAIYADDTQCYTILKSRTELTDVANKIEACYDDIQQWMNANRLKLNAEKSEFIIFRNRADFDMHDFTLHCGDSRLSPCDTVRNLGVTLHWSGSMESHVNNVARTSRFHLRKISKIRKLLTEDACRSLVQATVTSRIDYANSLLFGSPKYIIARLQKVQNAAARVVSRAAFREHISPILNDLHWLPVCQRINYKIILLTYKTVHGCGPSYLRECVTAQTERLRRTQHQNKLVVPRTLSLRGRRTFTYAAPVLWNALPPHLRVTDISLVTFKKELKTFLFTHQL